MASFANEEEHSVKISNRKKRILVATGAVLSLLLLICSIVVMVLLSHFYSKRSIFQKYGRFGIAIDAGGSGTRLLVYEYLSTQELRQIHFFECEDEGLSKHLSLSKMAGDLRTCILNAEHALPIKMREETPIFFGATGGMRLFRIKNESAYNNTLSTMREVLNNSTFPIQMDAALEGKKEALYSWITVNSLLKKKTGMIELGSTSFQIAFQNKNESELDGEWNSSPNVYSYLCLGKDEFTKRYHSKLIQRSHYKLNVSDPCRAKGYTKVIDADKVWNSPCVSGPYAVHLLGESIDPASGSQKYRINGVSNFNDCLNAVKNVFNNSSLHRLFGNNSDTKTPPHGDFTVIGGGAFYSSKFLNLDDRVTMQAYKNATEGLCGLTLGQLQSKEGYSEYANDYCLMDSYIYFLFHNLMELKGDAVRMTFVKKIDNTPLYWTRGALLRNLNELSPPTFVEKRLLSKAFFSAVITAAVCVTLLAIVLFVRSMKLCRSKYMSLDDESKNIELLTDTNVGRIKFEVEE